MNEEETEWLRALISDSIVRIDGYLYTFDLRHSIPPIHQLSRNQRKKLYRTREFRMRIKWVNLKRKLALTLREIERK